MPLGTVSKPVEQADRTEEDYQEVGGGNGVPKPWNRGGRKEENEKG